MRNLERMSGVAAALAAVVFAACGGGEASEPNEETGAGSVRSVNVEVMELAEAPFVEVLRVTGQVRADQDVVVAAEESGPIRRILVDKGARVRAGQPIAKIDDALLRSQVEQARAQAALAQETYERRKRLWEEDKVGSELAYLETKYAAEQARANLATLSERLDRTTVRAPISGVLEDRMVEVGSMVAPGTPVVRIVDLEPVKVVGGVPERYAAEVATGRRVDITLDALGGRGASGEIAFVGNTINERNRTFPIEVEVDNPGGIIKPEMVANIVLPLQELDSVVAVPQEALVRVENGFVAYVAVERDGQLVAEQRAVVLGPSRGNTVVVREGLAPGERLIVVGQQKVADGDPVTVVGGAQGSEPAPSAPAPASQAAPASSDSVRGGGER